MLSTGAVGVHLSTGVDKKRDAGTAAGPTNDFVLTLDRTLAVALAEHSVSGHLIDVLVERVKGIWRHEVTEYKTTHPDFVASRTVPAGNGRLQRVLPVQEAMLLAPRLLAIGLHRVHAETTQLWSELGLPGDIAEYVEDTLEEEY